MKTLIPILNTVKRTRERRETDWTLIDDWPLTKYNKQDLDSNLGRLQTWIDKNTTGRFYLDLYLVAFEDEKDFTIFKLWYKEQE